MIRVNGHTVFSCIVFAAKSLKCGRKNNAILKISKIHSKNSEGF